MRGFGSRGRTPHPRPLSPEYRGEGRKAPCPPVAFPRNVYAPASSSLMMLPHDFARLVDARGPALILYARQWCHAPEDVVQDAFSNWSRCIHRRATPSPGCIASSAMRPSTPARRTCAQAARVGDGSPRRLVRRTHGGRAGRRDRRRRPATAAGRGTRSDRRPTLGRPEF